MNKKKKSGKKVIGIAMAAIMIASMFAMIVPAFGARDAPPVQPGTSATYYLDPDDSSAPGKCENTTVQVWINSSIPFYGGVFTITTNASCGDIEIGSYVGNTTHFNQHAVYTDTGRVLNAGYRQAAFVEQPPGIYHVGNFTMHCNSTEYCITDLNFTLGIPNTYISNTTVPPGDYIVGADNGTFACEMPAPDIISFLPTSPASDYKDASRTFNITIDQPVNVTWLINGSVAKDSEKNVTEANYTNTSAVVGTWNVSAVVENECGGTNMQTWIWNVMEPPVVVNEFLADNSSGTHYDWVELYNPTGSSVDLTGWTLNDSTSQMELLSGSISTDGYLVVDVGNRLNTSADSIILLKNGVVVDQVTYGVGAGKAPEPPTDKSTGRHPDGMDTNNDSADFIVFDFPTPGARNTIPPNITSFTPPTPVSNNESESRTFNITIDQTVNVSWFINGSEVHTNTSVTEASYTNESAVAGYWNVSAIAANANSSDIQTWWWTVNDTTPPTVVPNSNSPSGTNVPVTTNITATFSEAMNSSTLNTATVLVENSTSSTVIGDVTYNSTARTVTFDPVSNLNYNETYNVTITTGVQDLAGNNMSSDFTWNFTTRTEIVESTIGIGNASVNAANTIILPLMIYNATNVGVIRVNLTYNQSVVMVINVTGVDFDVTIPNLEHNSTGSVRIGAFQTTNPGLNGTIAIADITLKAVGSAGQSSRLNISVNEFKDATPKGNDIPYRVSNGTFTVSTPPIADAGPDQTVSVNGTAQFNGSGSYDPDGGVVSYFWDFGDGTNATGVTSTHVYTVNGTYIVTLTVTDNNGAMGSDTCNITVNVPPVADAGPDQTVLVNETVQFNGSGSYDPDGEIVSYFWDFGDGTNGTDVNVTHIYPVNGTFIVTLNVTDNHNATDEDICNVTAYGNGDANGDGDVALFDAMYLAKSVLGITGWEAIEIASDVSGDGEVTLFDAMYLAKHVLGIQGFEELK